ncbi:MAG TPA: Gfo/Idh/MocA family oxidoreductase [Candidatus Eremiobacteraeota bacterium]|nr:MAG: Glucose-6-phosphate 3-dehydrogenase [bacterium ADurb.Bin363]HPZ09105.1 Gfo/Idh/MocA family oxidoreductase [Candidatus Eremiobacteraeota bacterium]
MKNICIVGCGNIAKNHIKRLSGSVLLYFYSKFKEDAEKFNKQFGGKGVFHSFNDMLGNSKIDGVVICSPPEFHKEQIISTLSADKAVLVEKPMCISEEEVSEIEEALKKSKSLFLMVAENYYYKPSLKKIKELLKYIGNIKSLSIKKAFTQNSSDWRSKYGSLLEGGVHFVSFLSDIVDDTPSEVKAEFPGYKEGEPERSSLLDLTYKSGIKGKLTYSWNTKSLPMGVFQTSYIYGDKGQITFESNGLYVYLKSESKTKLYIPDPFDLTGNKGLATDFLECLEENKPPYSDFYKAKRDLSIIFQAYKSAGLSGVLY